MKRKPKKNLALAGNPRYQPKSLQSILGYDNLYAPAVEVEIATLNVLGQLGIIPEPSMAKLTNKVKARLRAIRTTEVDQVERNVTKHDVRALVQIIQGIVGPELAQWVHVPLTSYDVLDPARVLLYKRAYERSLRPSLARVSAIFAERILEFSKQVQIGRTHGQHALPVTVGFWFACILNRILNCWEELDRHAKELEGKISGAVGAYNAQVGLGFEEKAMMKTGDTFEYLVMAKLGLRAAPISTQILQPERTAFFFFSATMLSGALAQFGRDCRHLMRSEIEEVHEGFDPNQVGSSTMAHKRNPINFEGLEGAYLKSKAELFKIMDTVISEHQRDLVGSGPMRDYITILVNLQIQLDMLLRPNRDKVPFLKAISIDKKACRRNMRKNANVILGEPLYIAMQMAGYDGDGHHFVNHVLVPEAIAKKKPLIEVLMKKASGNPKLKKVILEMPPEIIKLMHNPETYIGKAAEKAMEIAERAKSKIEYLSK